jgi:hypothetical protein
MDALVLSVARSASHFSVRTEQLVEVFRLDRLTPRVCERSNGKPELLQVGSAAGAAFAVAFKSSLISIRELAVEMRRHELDELFARDL